MEKTESKKTYTLKNLAMQNALNITDEQIKELQENVDAVYMYLDLHIDDMSQEEKDTWLHILEIIDPNYYNEENE